MTDLERLLEVLSRADIRFVIVGGVAATIHGSSRLTQDLDLVYGRTPADLQGLASALAPYQPYLRGAPPGLPFEWSARTLQQGLNFTLTTQLGDVDLLGEIIGGGGYDDVIRHTTQVTMFGRSYACLDLEWLIRTKRAAGRPRDLEAIAELEALRDETR
ncbi:MAG TPA: hypothetical protein DEQ40_10325 [Oxalobacteraceae bacterium]|nr:hypothetical protein [Oxalobacteraceae bacterium]